MSGNMRAKSGKKGSGRTEADYERARRQVLRECSICGICSEAIDKGPATKPICRYVDTSTATVATVLPKYCTGDVPCEHPRKAHPFSGSADHWPVPVSEMAPGDPRLTDPRALRATHLSCNRDRGAGNDEQKPLYKTSKNHYN